MAHILPPEMLASCFRFLPLPDLITASHVSHDWRATALAFPDLWETIRSDDFPPSLLAIALARSGNVPLSIEINIVADDVLDVVLAPILAPFVHRMRSFIARDNDDWHLELFDRPAPMLERLDFPSVDPITHDFLGGRAGSLKYLRLFWLELPRAGLCPALSSLTHLEISSNLPHKIVYGSLNRLFELCPLLERLHLDELANSVELPPGPAPRTLHALTLATTDPECCLFSVLRNWQTKALTDATLKFSRKSLTPECSKVLSGLVTAGLVELEIYVTSATVTVIRAVDSRNSVIKLTVHDVEVVRHLRPLLTPIFKSCEGTLRALAILDAQLPELKLPIPSLETLTLGVHYYAGATKGFQWARLRRLAHLGPGRVRITIEVRCRKQLADLDVREIMESLAFVGEHAAGEIDLTLVMHHTSQDTVRQAGLPDPLRFGKVGICIRFGSFDTKIWIFEFPSDPASVPV